MQHDHRPATAEIRRPCLALGPQAPRASESEALEALRPTARHATVGRCALWRFPFPAPPASIHRANKQRMTDAGPTPPRSTDHASLQRMAPARSSSSHWWRSHRRRRIHFAAASLPAGLRVPAGAARPAERPPKRQGLGARRQVDPGRATGPQQFLQVQGRATQGPGPAQTAKRLHSG